MSKRVDIAIFIFIILIFLAQCIHYFNHTLDDPFITFRYADNLVAGKGLVYNPGERVEGFSNPTWVFLMAICSALGFSDGEMGLLWCAKILGILFGCLTLYFVYFRTECFIGDNAVGRLAALLLSINLYFGLWSVSGLETPLYMLLLTVYFILLLNPASTARSLLTTQIILILLILTRPESFLLLIAYIFHVSRYYAGKHRAPPSRSTFGIAWMPLTISVIGLELSRYLYYHDFLPNTYYAKTLGGFSQISDGARYFSLGFLGITFNPLFALLTLAAIVIWFRIYKKTSSLSIIIVYTFFIIYAGGGWMPGFRFLAHITPILMIFLSYSLNFIYTKIKHRLLSFLYIIFISLLFMYSFTTQLIFLMNNYRIFSTGWTGISSESMVMPEYLEFGRKLSSILKPGETIALGEAGLIPYVSKAKVIDCFGLMDRHIGRLKGKMHNKTDIDYILDREPEYILLMYYEIDNGTIGTIFSYVDKFYNDERFNNDYELCESYSHFRLFRRRELRESRDIPGFLHITLHRIVAKHDQPVIRNPHLR